MYRVSCVQPRDFHAVVNLQFSIGKCLRMSAMLAREGAAEGLEVADLALVAQRLAVLLR